MLFSIVIPTYNYGHWLSHALDSAIAQPGDDYEIVIVDDGSTDCTRTVADEYCTKYPNRIRYVFQQNHGPSAARNFGANQANGDYLLFLDADDRLFPDALERFRILCRKDKDIDMAFGGHYSLDADGVTRKHPAKLLGKKNEKNFKGYLRKKLGNISHGSAIIRRTMFDDVKYPENVHLNEDVTLFAQLLAIGHCVSFPEPVVTVYKHKDSLRHDVVKARQAGLRAVDALFDPEILPAELMSLRQEFVCKHYLMQFRTLYRAGEYQEARQLYWKAIRSYPRYLLRLSRLWQFLRIAFK